MEDDISSNVFLLEKSDSLLDGIKFRLKDSAVLGETHSFVEDFTAILPDRDATAGGLVYFGAVCVDIGSGMTDVLVSCRHLGDPGFDRPVVLASGV